MQSYAKSSAFAKWPLSYPDFGYCGSSKSSVVGFVNWVGRLHVPPPLYSLYFTYTGCLSCLLMYALYMGVVIVVSICCPMLSRGNSSISMMCFIVL